MQQEAHTDERVNFARLIKTAVIVFYVYVTFDNRTLGSGRKLERPAENFDRRSEKRICRLSSAQLNFMTEARG